MDVPLEVAEARLLRHDCRRRPELGLELEEALAELREEFRIVVWLSDAEGFTSHEIARMLRLPQGTVASRLFRGRRCLRELLADLGRR